MRAGSSSAGDGTPLSLRDTSPTGETPAPDSIESLLKVCITQQRSRNRVASVVCIPYSCVLYYLRGIYHSVEICFDGSLSYVTVRVVGYGIYDVPDAQRHSRSDRLQLLCI